MVSEFIKTGNPIGKTDLIGQIAKALGKETRLFKTSIHGADAAFCSRKSVLHLALSSSEVVTSGPEAALYFSIGNAVHDTIGKAFRSAGVLIATEVSVEYDQVRGYIDNIIVSAETGELKIIDIKTCGALPAKIKPGQNEQLLAYALLTGITEASILYVSRNVANFSGLLIKEIQAPINSISMQKVARIVAESLVYAHHQIVPPMPEYHSTRMGCGWCPFKENGCYTVDEGIKPLSTAYFYGEVEELEAEVVKKASALLVGKSEFYKNFLEKLLRFEGTNRPTYAKWSSER